MVMLMVKGAHSDCTISLAGLLREFDGHHLGWFPLLRGYICVRVHLCSPALDLRPRIGCHTMDGEGRQGLPTDTSAIMLHLMRLGRSSQQGG